MRLLPALLGVLLVASACGRRAGDGGGTGDRRGVAKGSEGAHDPSRPTPAAGAPTRGALSVALPTGEVRIGQAELADCPEDGCPLADLVALPRAERWCIDEADMPRRELSANDVKGLRVIARTKGGVKLVPPGTESALARSPARLYPCP